MRKREGGTSGLTDHSRVPKTGINNEVTSLVPKSFNNVYTFIYLSTYLYLEVLIIGKSFLF